MSEPKLPNSIDRHVGAQMRLRRKQLGYSQEKLGEILGLTFQQIQKYEKGLNRISAGRLFEISKILQAPVSFFFEGAYLESERDAQLEAVAEDNAPSMLTQALTTESVNLLSAFSRVGDQKSRKALIDMANAMANAQAPGE